MDLSQTTAFADHGVRSPVTVMTASEAARARADLETAEAELGSMHYRHKVETLLRSAFDLATQPSVLDAVEACIGPDILLYNCTYIIKEPGSEANVAWHQDLTYWGLSDDDAQVSMWLALAPATPDSGCMRMIPGSHHDGRVEHETGSGNGNVLQLGQYIANVDDADAIHVPLEPGEASFHHGWTVHCSAPNVSNDRRIGLNVQYLAPHVTFAGDRATAALVRGQDRHGYFEPTPVASADLDPDAVRTWQLATEAMRAGFEVN